MLFPLQHIATSTNTLFANCLPRENVHINSPSMSSALSISNMRVTHANEYNCTKNKMKINASYVCLQVKQQPIGYYTLARMPPLPRATTTLFIRFNTKTLQQQCADLSCTFNDCLCIAAASLAMAALCKPLTPICSSFLPSQLLFGPLCCAVPAPNGQPRFQ